MAHAPVFIILSIILIYIFRFFAMSAIYQRIVDHVLSISSTSKDNIHEINIKDPKNLKYLVKMHQNSVIY